MNARLIAGHATVAAIFTTVWEVAIAMPAGPANSALVVAGLVGPSAIASVSLALINAAEDRPQQSTPPPVPAPRRAVTAHARRKELSR